MTCSTLRSFRFRAISTALAAALFATSTRAEDISAFPRLARGKKARIEFIRSGPPAIGDIQAVDEQSVTIRTTGGATRRIERAEIQSAQIKVEVGRQTTKGALSGAGVGLAVGAAIGVSYCSDDFTCKGAGDHLLVASFLGAIVMVPGAGAGAVIGYQMKETSWVEVMHADDVEARQSKRAVDIQPGPTGAPVSETRKAPLLKQMPQGDPALATGARVRVHSAGRMLEGFVVDTDESSVSLATSGGNVSVLRRTITGLDTYGGEKKRVLRGALIGAVVATGIEFTSPPTCLVADGETPKPCSRLSSASTSVLGGGIIGSLVGLAIKRTVWNPSGPRTATSESAMDWNVSPTIGRGGGGLQVHLAW